MFFAWSKTDHFQLTDAIIEKVLEKVFMKVPKGKEPLLSLGVTENAALFKSVGLFFISNLIDFEEIMAVCEEIAVVLDEMGQYRQWILWFTGHPAASKTLSHDQLRTSTGSASAWACWTPTAAKASPGARSP